MDFKFDSDVIHVNVPTRDRLEAMITDRFRAGRGFALATINLDHLVKLASPSKFRTSYAQHDFIVADGNPIVWLSRLAGRPVELIPGSEMVMPLARLAAREGVPIAMVGSTDEALRKAASRMERDIPGLKVAACIAPEFGFDPDGATADEVFEALNASGAGFCFLALGAPKQEIFAARGRTVTPQIGYASIGAGVDFIAGHQVRAPVWVRRLAMEWVWRMASSPRRLIPRYLGCLAIMPRHIMQALSLRRTPPGAQH